MKEFDSIQLMQQPTAVAIGYFDSIHLGHARVLSVAAQAASEGLLPTVLTFDMQAVRPQGKGQQDLFSLDQRKRYIAELGMEQFVQIPFGLVREMSPEDFVQQILTKNGLNAKLVVVGTDFRFGYQRAGSAEDLRLLCEKAGIRAVSVDAVMAGGEEVSTSRIKALIQEGQVEEAAQLLGRPYEVEGVVEDGNHLARILGFPTANIPFPSGCLVPKRGVYRSIAIIQGESYPAITNIGVRPTVTKDVRETTETHLIGFEGDLYGQTIRVSLLEFIRPEKKFDSQEELRKEVMANIQYSQSRFRSV